MTETETIAPPRPNSCRADRLSPATRAALLRELDGWDPRFDRTERILDSLLELLLPELDLESREAQLRVAAPARKPGGQHIMEIETRQLSRVSDSWRMTREKPSSAPNNGGC